MVRFNAWDSSSISTLFSSFGSRGSSGSLSGVTSFLSNVDINTYSSIRSGTYSKLLKSYYSDSLDSKASSIVKSSISTSEDDTKTLSKIQSEADDLVKSAQDLYKNGSKDDTDATYKKVSAFVDDYNNLVSAASKSETSKITKNLESMQSYTNVNAKSLAKIGISVDSQTGKLSIDEDTFKKADQTKVKSLFSGNGSYAYGVATKASMLEYTAKSEAEKSNTYSASGRYNDTYSSGSNYNYFL